MEPVERTAVETRIVELLRSRIEHVIDNCGREWAASRLKMSAPGIEAILWNRSWSTGTAIHLAACLDVLTDEDVDRLSRDDAVA
jgi:hypothetical protein